MNDLTVRLPETAEARGRIAPKHFAHIVYKTPRFAEMIDWYATVLECEPVLKNELLCFMTYDDEHHRIAIANQPHLKDKPKDTAGVEHCAYTYGTLEDLAATYERLKASARPTGASTTASRCPCTTATPTPIRWSCRSTSSTARRTRQRGWSSRTSPRIRWA
jgi:hypothetical protein